MTGQYLPIVASHNDTTATLVDGFILGHSFSVKVWVTSESRIITPPTEIVGDNTFEIGGASTVKLSNPLTTAVPAASSTTLILLTISILCVGLVFLKKKHISISC